MADGAGCELFVLHIRKADEWLPVWDELHRGVTFVPPSAEERPFFDDKLSRFCPMESHVRFSGVRMFRSIVKSFQNWVAAKGAKGECKWTKYKHLGGA